MSGALRSNTLIAACDWPAVAAVFGLLTGCGTYGDFGRLRPIAGQRRTHAWMGPPRAAGDDLAGKHQLTEEERTLRDLAYPLIEPPYDRQMVQRARRSWAPQPAVALS